MKKVFFSTAFLILMLPFYGISQQFALLTYNIHHAQNEAGKLDVEGLARYIAAQKADVVVLQEVDSACGRSSRIDIMRELGRLTGMYYYFGIAMPYDGGGYGEGLLSRLPLLSVRTIPLPARAGKEPRAAIEALISLGGNKQFKLVGTHLDHTKDETDRIAQARHLQDLFRNEPLPFLIAGDLNAQPTEATMGIFKSFTHWPDKDKLQFTCPSSKPSMKIDYMLLSNNYPWKCSRFEVLPEKLISDHLPVKAVFSL